jgi:hypothetical protein
MVEFVPFPLICPRLLCVCLLCVSAVCVCCVCVSQIVENPDETFHMQLLSPGVKPSFGGDLWARALIIDDGDGTVPCLPYPYHVVRHCGYDVNSPVTPHVVRRGLRCCVYEHRVFLSPGQRVGERQDERIGVYGRLVVAELG